MAHPRRLILATPYTWGVAFFCLCLSAGCHGTPADPQVNAGTRLRVATFNTGLSRDEQGALRAAMQAGDDARIKLVAEVLQRTRPDIVLLQEVDYDPTGRTYEALQTNYLGVAQNGAEPIDYPYRYAPEVNTGVSTGVDLNGDGEVAAPHDAHGWGNYPGHYGMVVLSKYPIDEDAVRTFRELRWIDASHELLEATGYYSDEASQVLRLSSKTHADVPVAVPGMPPLHLFISHPTPPVFDGPENRNGYRNAAEIVFWVDYLDSTPLPQGTMWLDDAGEPAQYMAREPFVILGDLNADPNDGDSLPGAISGLLQYEPGIQPIAPTSAGAVEAAERDGGANLTHQTDPATDTADWNDTPPRGSGNLRVDYVLPSVRLDVLGSGVFWPKSGDPLAYLLDASDHRLVWVDLNAE